MTTAEKCAHSLRVVMGESADTNAALLLQLEGGGVTLPPMPLGDDLGEGGIERGGYDEGSQLSAASPGFGSFDDSGFRLAEEEGVGGGPLLVVWRRKRRVEAVLYICVDDNCGKMCSQLTSRHGGVRGHQRGVTVTT